MPQERTNLIKAISFAQDYITKGKLEIEQNKLAPFLLDGESRQKPSRFEFEFKCGLMMLSYRYGFLVDSKRVHSEWLYEIKSASETMMFERETDSQGHTNVKIGEVNVLVTNEEEPFDFIRRFRPNELFLTAVNMLKDQTDSEYGTSIMASKVTESVSILDKESSSTIRPESRISFLDLIYDWFDRTLVTVFPDSIPTQGIGLGIMKNADLRHRLKDVLDLLDLGIDGVDLVPIEFDAESELTDEFRESVKRRIQNITEDSNERLIFGRYGSEKYLTVDAENKYSAYKLVTLHHVKDENRYVAFDLTAESDGTRHLLELMPALLGLHSEQPEHVFVVDELDRSIHAHLSCKVVELFLTNGGIKHSQLIVTSHDYRALGLRPPETR